VTPLDRRRRPLQSLRISVTDRCNLRCAYCMPEEDYAWLPKPRILRFEELAALYDAFALLGVTRVRLTGGEPLLRRDLDRLVALLAARPGLTDLALTTNGLLLAELAAPLAAAGLSRVTVSLDTLRPERHRALTRRDGLERVLAGIAAARAAGLPLKLNTVVLRGTNDDELEALVEFARAHGAEARFIEYMDVGGATRWQDGAVVPREEILARLGAAHGPARPLPRDDAAPAERYRLGDGTVVGVIASTTAPFCGSCDRARLTADGRLFTCLYARDGLPLAEALRAGATPAELARLVGGRWRDRADRGAEERLGLAGRGALAGPDELRADPHLEMHTRGG
jgi:cyclic pyranopterin phosphate synthase